MRISHTSLQSYSVILHLAAPRDGDSDEKDCKCQNSYFLGVGGGGGDEKDCKCQNWGGGGVAMRRTVSVTGWGGL